MAPNTSKKSSRLDSTRKSAVQKANGVKPSPKDSTTLSGEEAVAKDEQDDDEMEDVPEEEEEEESDDEQNDNDVLEEESDDDEEDEDSEEDTDMSDDDEPVREKDDTELELEKLVFGDSAGFRDAVADFGREEAGESEPVAAITNDHLFFIDDTGTGTEPNALLAERDEADDVPPAWQDSDDERMTVSLMAVPKLRKLRTFEGEDTISGSEYIRRLRKQYEVLHPRPAWASDQGPNKRRRLSNDEDENEDESDDDMDIDRDQPISQTPLAKLLRDGAPLTRISNDSGNPNVPPQLKPEVVTINRFPDISPTQPHSINSLSIHPTLPLLLSAGLSSTMYLHRIDLNPTPPDPPNPLVTSLHLKGTPLTTAAFSPGADGPADPKIYLSGPRRYFHTWTLPSGTVTKTTRIYGEQDTTQTKCQVLRPSPCGRYIALQGTSRKGAGVVNILSAATTQWQAQARAEGRGGLAAFAWWADGEGLTLAAKTGELVEWSVASRAVVARWADPGAVAITALALTPDPSMPHVRASPKQRRRAADRARRADGTDLGPDRYVVLGTASGLVSIYDRRAIPVAAAASPVAPAPAPIRTLDQLTTPITSLAASPCGQLLAIASRWSRDALRLVHLPSAAVYRNWPTGKTPLGRVASVAIGEVADGARTARVLVVGNEKGALRIWEVGG